MPHDVLARQSLWVCLLTIGLQVAYAVALTIGLAARATPADPIPDPYFTIMELLILLLAPAMTMVALVIERVSTEPGRLLARAGTIWMASAAVLTVAVHSAILILSRRPDFQGMDHVFAFRWPSVVYVLDIVAWDGFFALSVLASGASLLSVRRARWAAFALILAGVLALAGLAGVALDDMRFRNIGILGYVPVYTLAVSALVAFLIRGMRL